MICKVPRTPVCLAIAFCVQAVAFQLVAIAGVGWEVAEYKYGLFRYCWRTTCDALTDMKDWFKVCQAFSILGLLAVTGTLAFGILHFFVEDTRVLSRCGIASCFSSVIFLVIEFSVFAAKSSDDRPYFSLGYGFILSILACILCFFSGVMFAVELHYSSPNINFSVSQWSLDRHQVLGEAHE